tara:strand:+ start:4199 stop:4426 length:228 start_codon:yes stop_codon:yes gene_type:complete
MIKITNKQKCPVQLVIRSRTKARAFTTLNIPGRGAGKNVYLLEDERHTEYVDRVEKMGLISTKYVPNQEIIREGE